MQIGVRALKMLLAVDLLLFCGWHSALFEGRVPGHGRNGGGLPVTGMTT